MPSGSGNNRQSDRSYLIESKDIAINGKAFRLSDIALEGFGVVVESEHTFFMGQRLNKIELTAGNQSRTLKGIVSHITKNQHHIVCGVRFDFADHNEMEFVARFTEETGS
jgi:hypothetical protein